MRPPTSATDRQMFGKLGSVSLNDIIQLLGMAKRTATLELRRGNERGRLYFRDGQIIHASAGRYEGEESFIELLGWADAEFSVKEGIHSLPKISITKSTEALLLSTMTSLDEVARITGRRAVGAPPPTPTRRLPPRPRKQRQRRTGTRALVLIGSITGLACAPVLWLALAPAGENNLFVRATPWHNLPAIANPRPRKRELKLIPDAWSVASAIWAQPPPSADAPPPAPSRASTDSRPGFLTVVVEPWGRVVLDGREVGETPLGKLELLPGTYRLTLANDHVIGVIHDDVVIEPGTSVLKRYSFDDVGYLQVVALPWADVSVDGRAIGQTPLARVAVPAGPHAVRFVHPELGESERSVEVSSGRTTLVKVRLPENAP